MNAPATDTRHQGDTRMTEPTETDVEALRLIRDAAEIACDQAGDAAIEARSLAERAENAFYVAYVAARDARQALKENTE
jgi:hypothetical protein